MRVAIVTESFLPSRNGVTTSVCRVTEELTRRGHEVAIICPGPAPESYAGAEVHALPTVSVREFPTGLPTYRVEALLAEFRPDVVHLASPFAVGARGVYAAARLGLPTVAIYQTDMPSYIAQHAPMLVARGAGATAWHWIRLLHNHVDRTLAPSAPTMSELAAHGVERVHLWGRGVDTALYSPTLCGLRRFVHTGTKETFGQTLQEAAATALPVVAPAAGGPLDLVRSGVTGYLFDPHRPGALSACVGELVGNPALRAAVGSAGYAQAQGRSWGALTGQLLEHYAAARARAFKLVRA